ncbi:MAG: 1,2-phenylacetyl-CoA epoxidase subunit PaaD [Arenicella sp.]
MTNQIQASSSEQELIQLRKILETVCDPEIPVLTIDEMGILRDVSIDNGTVSVTITPTYSGCPAMDQITADINAALLLHGYSKARVSLVFSPAWTTDWMSEKAKEKLRNYGIAPPCKTSAVASLDDELALIFTAPCPRCNSLNTQLISQFGSTACKALWKCNACQEPFDYFKPL